MVGRGMFLASVCFTWFAAGSLVGQTTGWKIEAGPEDAKPGQTVTLHVSATEKHGGRVTLFDGVVPLGTTAFSDRGEAILRTNLLSPGAHSIRAVGWGTPASASPVVNVTVAEDKPERYSKEKSYPAGPAQARSPLRISTETATWIWS